MQFLDVFFLSCGAFFRPNEKLDNKSDETGGETGPNTLSYLDDGNSRADHFKNLEGSRTEGTSGNDRIFGNLKDNLIIGNGGRDFLTGGRGDDTIIAQNSSYLTGLYGNKGDDILIASIPGIGQIHMGGGDGDDLIIADLTNYSGRQGHHIYTGRGNDTVEFDNIVKMNSPVLGRIDDFDVSRDVLVFEGRELELNDLPESLDVVLYLGQQWLRIGDNSMYALEGAREGGSERHFSEFPEDISALEVVEFVDQQNFVPQDVIIAQSAGLNDIKSNSNFITGTDGSDWIHDEQTSRSKSKDGNTQLNGNNEYEYAPTNGYIQAGHGDDVVDAGKGYDIVMGGEGHDFLAGGLDDDTLYGENGDDFLYGGSEDDNLYGGVGEDTLAGGTGDDVLAGGTGDDVILGGQGADDVSGGKGSDAFKFSAGDLVEWSSLEGTNDDKFNEIDMISDFEVGFDTISFGEDVDVNKLSDLWIYAVEVDNEDLVAISLIVNGECFLVNAKNTDGSTSKWYDLKCEDNFIFG